MNNRYLEIDSTYRDRTKYPKPGQFEVPIASGPRKDQVSAYDPVSLGVPVKSWTSNNFSVSVPMTWRLFCTIEPKTTRLSGLTDTISFIINSTSRLQQIDDYYRGAIAEDAAFFNRRRIKKYKFLGSFALYDRAEITVEVPFPETFVPTNQIYIYDPTDLSNPDYPVFFVPTGSINENAYNHYLLYNETLNDFRSIESYNNSNKCVYLNLTNDPRGDVSSWGLNDNYSLRKDTPYLPPLNGSNATVLSNVTNTVEIDTSYTENIVNKYIRIIPSQYNYNITNEINRRITAYNNITNMVTVYPSIDEVIPVGSKVEILNFSFDNSCPFIYTGSQLSQQELVCYEIELLSLTLPPESLSVMDGGSITHYPYVYVELSNTINGGLRNILYSNNPNSTRALFKVPCFDIQDPPVYIKIGGGQVQTIKFKPNDTLMFSVFMPNGEIFDTIIPERFSPAAPEPRIQVSATFGIRRVQ